MSEGRGNHTGDGGSCFEEDDSLGISVTLVHRTHVGCTTLQQAIG